MFTTRSDIDNLPFAVLHISSIFKKHGVSTWLCYGALLWMIREGHLLPWNNVVELGFTSPRLSSRTIYRLLNTLSSHGYLATFYSTSRSFSVWHPRLSIQVNINHFFDTATYLSRPHEMCSQPSNSTSILAQSLWWLSTLLGAKVSFQWHDLLTTPIFRTFRLLFVCIIQQLPRSFRLSLSLYFLSSCILYPSSSTMVIPRDFVFPLNYIGFYGSEILFLLNRYPSIFVRR